MIKNVTDGNSATAHIAYALSDAAAIYPITPSSAMAEACEQWSTENKKNLFGNTMQIVEMQSEGGAAGTVHGLATAGALATTFTASQGLLLMIPNMYKLAGELLPCVFHISARTIATHALSIFGDHSDVMACRQTGFAMLCSASVQECADLSLVAHLATIESSVPFLHFFDGFRTSHEINKIDQLEYSEILPLVDFKKIEEFRIRALNPEHPMQHGTAQNPDIFFQNREATNKYYENLPNIVENTMKKVASVTGRNYNLFDYVGDPNAEYVCIIMGSGGEAVENAVDYLNAQGKKTGVLKVRLYRPFSLKHFVNALPKSVKKIVVLDRTKESGASGEPLYLDVCASLKETSINAFVVGGRYGLSSKEFTPSMALAVFKNLFLLNPKTHFTIGINDDVTNTSLKVAENINVLPIDTISCMFYGVGSDGTTSSNKNTLKIIANNTQYYTQGYFVLDSKKAGGITISHLRFGKFPIRAPYLIEQADLVACHNTSYITRYDLLHNLKEGGIFLLNSPWNLSQMEENLPAYVKNEIARKKIKFYNIDANKIAEEVGLRTRINVIMQVAFFEVSKIMDSDAVINELKSAAKKTYAKKGAEVIEKNYKAIDNAQHELQEVKYPKNWLTTVNGAVVDLIEPNEYTKNFIQPIQYLRGDSLPVSAFNPSGAVPTNTSQYEKRGISNHIPKWVPANCIQCNMCSFVCPHSAIRPVLVKKGTDKPVDFDTINAQAMNDYEYRMQVSPLDCTGCESCVNICPAREKALVMTPTEDLRKTEIINHEFAMTLDMPNTPFKIDTVKGSQFLKPYFEYSGACPGCGETPYIKLATQLFGNRMIIANATGCSSIYGGSAPTCPYSTDKKGNGPAWANSLFEDNAEFGLGIRMAIDSRIQNLINYIKQAAELDTTLKPLFIEYLQNINNAEHTIILTPQILEVVTEKLKTAQGRLKELLTNIYKNRDILIKKSIWIIGGDGWAYDIGFGGLDHVLSLNKNINILVLDTEIYSNTGGQTSKSTPEGSVAKFSAMGKRTAKKDLALMAMASGNAYVAQVSMGANPTQLIKTMIEAENYNGPSIIIAYSTCVGQGIDMSNGQRIQRRAVESGYFSLFRYNPALKAQGKNPFTMDSREPSLPYIEFLKEQDRYRVLLEKDPVLAEQLFTSAEQTAKEKIARYKRLFSTI
ncbi:MAG: pyruvate:ferredoxin (flavodoxin) oxidoreductase [Clostridia bacterium]